MVRRIYGECSYSKYVFEITTAEQQPPRLIFFSLRFAHTHKHTDTHFNNCFHRMLASVEGVSVCTMCDACRLTEININPMTIGRSKSPSLLVCYWFQINQKNHAFLPFNFLGFLLFAHFCRVLFSNFQSSPFRLEFYFFHSNCNNRNFDV